MGTLNVVFHGTFGFINWTTERSELEVLVPLVTGHAYLAGTWLQEQELIQGNRYNLVVDLAKPALVPDLGKLGVPLVEHKTIGGVNRNPDVVFCSLFLPLPTEPMTGRHRFQSSGGKIFSGAAATAATREMTSYATAHILIYDVTDVSAVRLSGLDWTPTVKGDSANLHIFAEPPTVMPIGHRLEAFQQLVKVLNADLKITAEGRSTTLCVDDPPPIEGLPHEQFFNLDDRHYRPDDGDPAGCSSGGV